MKRLQLLFLSLAVALSVSAKVDNPEKKSTTLMVQGVQLLEEGKTDMAAQILHAAEAVDSTNDAVQYYLGMIAASRNKASDALRHFEAARRLDSTNYWYNVRLGKVYSAIGRTADAERINRYLLAVKPNDAEVISYAVDLAIQSGDVEKADSLLGRIDVLMGPTDYSRMTRLELLRQKGDFKAFFSGLNDMFSDAEVPASVKKDFIDNMLKTADPRFNYVHLADYDTLVTTCVRVHPSDTAILHYASGFYYSLKKYDKVRELFSANSEDIYVCEALLYSYIAEKKWKEAIEVADHMLPIAMGDDNHLLSIILSKATCYQEMGQHDNSFREYDKACRIKPDDPVLLNNYAYHLAVVGRNLAKAAKMSKKAVTLQPENETFLDTYGWVLYKQKKYSQAKIYLKKAIIYGGKESAVVLRHYASVLEALGETALAAGYRQQAKLKQDAGKE